MWKQKIPEEVLSAVRTELKTILKCDALLSELTCICLEVCGPNMFMFFN